ncbi:hypothetical protein BDZ45DRAFT_681926 [Acephala macrosclerotiorum]|nr:hypothetical protein BDZ45DRAFT_681926 [Acephala macrosclerotiorum]
MWRATPLPLPGGSALCSTTCCIIRNSAPFSFSTCTLPCSNSIATTVVQAICSIRIAPTIPPVAPRASPP